MARTPARVTVLAERVNALTDDLAEMTANYARACSTIALMHEAATGRQGEAAQQGVVEDVAAVRARMLALERLYAACLALVDGDPMAPGYATLEAHVNHALAAVAACKETP